MPVIPALRSLRQEDHELKPSLGYITSLKPAWVHSLSQNTNNNNNNNNIINEKR
jgi:hypothetical protein